jgi:hypothetical protein
MNCHFSTPTRNSDGSVVNLMDRKNSAAGVLQILDNKSCLCRNDKFDKVSVLTGNLKKVLNPARKDNFSTARKLLRYICSDCPKRDELQVPITD